MEKFSLYDLLAVLFPGVIFLYMLNVIRELYNILPGYALTDSWELLIVMALVFGGLNYVISFQLTSKLKWIYKITGLYKHVNRLYLCSQIHNIIGSTLNSRANAWYGKDIFLSETEFNQLSENQKTELNTCHDNFYDRMYYELEYAGKLDSAKSFQSFYLFFRNLFVASLISIFLTAILYIINLVPILSFSATDGESVIAVTSILFLVLLCSVFIAQWYRKRTILKMYWFFYMHINFNQLYQ